MVHNGSCEKFQMELLPSMYGIEFCVALAGNLFGLWLLGTRQRQNWHTGVVFSCNLAISDLLYVLTLPLLIIYYAQGKNWRFGTPVCKIERFLFTCNLYASIFFIMCISVNRCVGIVYPFFTRSYVRPAHAKAVSVAVWGLVVAISSPVLKFASTCSGLDLKNTTMCVSYCNTTQERSHFIYKVFLTVFGCCVPFFVTFCSYGRLFCVVWKNANLTKLEKRKVALMVISVVVLYALSFVPYHALQTYHLYLKINYPKVFVCPVYKAYQISKGLATLNMCVHPLLYMAVFDNIGVVCCGRTSKQGNNEEMNNLN